MIFHLFIRQQVIYRQIFFGLFVLLCLLMNTAVLAEADSNASNQQKIKVAFVYNFTKYFRWPDNVKSASEEFHICLVDGGLSDNVFSSLEGEGTQGKTIKLRKLSFNESKFVAGSCHVLYIHAAFFEDAMQLLEALKGSDVLIVSDAVDSAKNGGGIEFVNIANKIKFRINQAAIEERGLKVSALLLRLATK